MFLTSPNLEGVPHGFFMRGGGVSTGLYSSLNCGWGAGDDHAHVAENRSRVAAALGAAHLCSVYQVHGADAATATQGWPREAMPKADAMVTATPGIALGILTADCVPVLFADPRAGVIGAAHAGWKGALAGILESTIAAMEALGAKKGDISAAVGPAIAQPSYEVGADLHGAYRAKDPRNAAYFLPSDRPGHWRFDLKGYVRDRFKAAGLMSVNMLENDTYLEENAFFSYRRMTHRGEADYGRHISAIMLRE